MKRVQAIVVAIAMAGWILPLWVCGNTLLVYREGMEAGRVDSFPHLLFAKNMFAIAMLWCFIALLTRVLWRMRDK